MPGYFISEFGVTGFSSFESLSPYFHPEHYGLHTPPFHRRSHNHDSLIFNYFGSAALQRLDVVGERPFKAALYLSMLPQALHLHSMVDGFHVANLDGALVWDLGEIWPTAGWGILEHGSTSGSSPGAIEGGR